MLYLLIEELTLRTTLILVVLHWIFRLSQEEGRNCSPEEVEETRNGSAKGLLFLQLRVAKIRNLVKFWFSERGF